MIEVKRVYKHPNYRYPKLYNDLAMIELGRRITYDYKKVGVGWLSLIIREMVI